MVQGSGLSEAGLGLEYWEPITCHFPLDTSHWTLTTGLLMSDETSPQRMFFDCNVRLGRTARPRPGEPLDVGGLRRDMEYFGLSRALVYHALAREFDPAQGNAQLMRELDGAPGFEPCWVLLPPHTGETPPPEELVVQMAVAGARAVRLFPADHQFRLSEWNCGALLGVLEAGRVPVLLEAPDADWDKLHEICSAFPLLPVVVLRQGYRSNRYLYPLLERHQSLYFEIGMLQTHVTIEEIARLFGARRLLFGSGLPEYTPGGPIAMIAYADISPEDKALIAGGNLSTLLEAAHDS